MVSSTALSSSNLPPTSPPSSSSSSPPTTGPASPSRKTKTSPQLNQWCRARTVRSGRKLDRPVQDPSSGDPTYGAPTPGGISSTVSGGGIGEFSGPVSSLVKDSGGAFAADEAEGIAYAEKPIYMVSDGTGWTAEHSVNGALGQFDYCLVDGVCPVITHLFSGIDDLEWLMEVIKQAAKEGAMLVYTLADLSMAESARQACQLWGVPSFDILGPITEAIANHLGVSPTGRPHLAPGRTNTLSDNYFRRIEAIEFTIKQDDGALPENLRKADIILVGVSRTGKTPLSIYLGQKGYKVANVPIVMGVNLPSTLFEVDPEKVFGLTINAVVLQTIRRARIRSLGFGEEVRDIYSEMDNVKAELEFAGRIFAQNPVWPVIEVTGKAIEETAAIVLRILHDRKNKYSMPRISKRY